MNLPDLHDFAIVLDMSIPRNRWSLLMGMLSVVGVRLQRKNIGWAWRYSLASQAVWLVYGMLTAQAGVVLMSFLFAWQYVQNLRSGRTLAPAPAGEDRPCPAAR